MKKILLLPIALLLCSVTFFTSCEKDDDVILKDNTLNLGGKMKRRITDAYLSYKYEPTIFLITESGASLTLRFNKGIIEGEGTVRKVESGCFYNPWEGVQSLTCGINDGRPYLESIPSKITKDGDIYTITITNSPCVYSLGYEGYCESVVNLHYKGKLTTTNSWLEQDDIKY